MNYKVTMNDQQIGKWFDNAKLAHEWVNGELAKWRNVGAPRLPVFKVYYNPTGTQVNEQGVPIR